MSCNCCGAEKLFDIKNARKDLQKYKKKGPSKPTRKLIEAIGNGKFEGKTLLDIGGGIGAMQWHFLKYGGARTTDMDYSDGYLEVAGEYAEAKGWSDRTTFEQGDFMEDGDTIEVHDIVTLDKVVCCYPDYKGLLTQALSKTNSTIGLVYPLGGWIAKVVSFFGRLYLQLTGNSFRPYIHPVAEIRQTVADRGFQNVHSSICFPWHVEVYERI